MQKDEFIRHMEQNGSTCNGDVLYLSEKSRYIVFYSLEGKEGVSEVKARIFTTPIINIFAGSPDIRFLQECKLAEQVAQKHDLDFYSVIGVEKTFYENHELFQAYFRVRRPSVDDLKRLVAGVRQYDEVVHLRSFKLACRKSDNQLSRRLDELLSEE